MECIIVSNTLLLRKIKLKFCQLRVLKINCFWSIFFFFNYQSTNERFPVINALVACFHRNNAENPPYRYTFITDTINITLRYNSRTPHNSCLLYTSRCV